MRTTKTCVELCGHVEAIYVGLQGRHPDGGAAMTVGDAMALVDYWTCLVAQVRMTIDVRTCHRAVERWVDVVEHLRDAAVWHAWLDEAYSTPQSLLSAVRRLARELDRIAAYMSFREGFGGFRNAATTSIRGNAVRIGNVGSWLDVFDALVEHYASRRGVVASVPSGTRVPNTTVSEVLGMADYWTAYVDHVESQLTPETQSAIATWHAAITRTLAAAKGAGPSDLFSDNASFWPSLRLFIAALDRVRTQPVQPEFWFYLEMPAHTADAVTPASVPTPVNVPTPASVPTPNAPSPAPSAPPAESAPAPASSSPSGFGGAMASAYTSTSAVAATQPPAPAGPTPFSSGSASGFGGAMTSAFEHGAAADPEPSSTGGNPLLPYLPSTASVDASALTKKMIDGMVPFGPFVGAKDPGDIYRSQMLAAFRERGYDEMDAPPGHPFGGAKMRIPRTTNADAIALIDYWSRWFSVLDADDQPGVVYVRTQWAQIAADVRTLATARPSTAAYEKNNELWRELPNVATQLTEAQNREALRVADAAAKLGNPLGYVATAVGGALKEWGHAAGHAAHEVLDAAEDAGSALWHGAGDALGWLKNAATVPIVLGGSVAVALLLSRR